MPESTPASNAADTRLLIRYLYASVAAAIATIALKTLAATLTGSVGFLSDALESGVNLVAALVALYAVWLAARPPDDLHDFGHGKAEYLSAAIEGAMVFAAATLILWSAVNRLIDPQPVDQPALGLALITAAALINLGVGLMLVRAGRRHRSMTLYADGQHLLTDVWTSAGVLVSVGLVALFDWQILDPIVAILVALNILTVGYRLLRRSFVGLLDAALPDEDVAMVEQLIAGFAHEFGIGFEPLRTRESGRQRFVYVTMSVPGHWTVHRSHELTERLEREIGRVLPGSVTFVHVEPADG